VSRVGDEGLPEAELEENDAEAVNVVLHLVVFFGLGALAGGVAVC